MSSVDAKFIDQSTQNINILKSEERREAVTIFGLSLPAVLTILIVVFLPIFWLSSLSFYNAAGELSMENYTRIFNSGVVSTNFCSHFPNQYFCYNNLCLTWLPIMLLVVQIAGSYSWNFNGFCTSSFLDFGSCTHLRLACAVYSEMALLIHHLCPLE